MELGLVHLLLLIHLSGKLLVIGANREVQLMSRQKRHQQVSHPSLLVDTKHWISNTQFGERDNWSGGEKPCTLLERIRLQEPSVVSLGDALDVLDATIDSNVKEILLSTDGMLLLEENSPPQQADLMFVNYLNQTGDCSELNGQSFVFQPESDRLSWFNPDNWASELNEAQLVDLIPESHRIPCSEDSVVFGSRKLALKPTIEANERSKTVSFKVNFRASESMDEQLLVPNMRVNNLRVSRLTIGEHSYSNQEFQTLVQSDSYRDILFQFDDIKSVLRFDEDFEHTSRALLVVDESSIRSDSTESVCLDDAGCKCGNEETNVMKVICSFREPIEYSGLPCIDPIPSAGYCDNVCATVMIIVMDPSKFNEPFMVNTLNKLLTDGERADYFSENIFIGSRRTHSNKYEITFRLILGAHVRAGDQYDQLIGRDREFAAIVHERLNSAATKSFYGIKSINLRSSVLWRRQNRNLVFWTTFIALFSMLVVLAVCKDFGLISNEAFDWTGGIISNKLNKRRDQTAEDSISTDEFDMTNTLGSSSLGESVSNIPLLDLQAATG